MKIQSTSAYTANSTIENSNRQHNSSAATADFAAPTTSVADKITISKSARERASDVLEEGGSYDFSNLSSDNVLDTINTLIKSGRMTLDESSALLAFVPLTELNAALGGPAIANHQVNMFDGLKRMIAYNESIHNDGAVIASKKALVAIERLQGTSKES